MKRSHFTHYTYLRCTIYEYRSKYFIIEECQQGQVLNPAHGPRQLASDYSALSATLSYPYEVFDMGSAVLEALGNFDSQPHPFDQFDIPSRNKIVTHWTGARGINVLEKNSRRIHVEQDLVSMDYSLFPYDNCNVNPWNGPLCDCEPITLPGFATPEEIGAAVRETFARSTYHPERKDPRMD